MHLYVTQIPTLMRLKSFVAAVFWSIELRHPRPRALTLNGSMWPPMCWCVPVVQTWLCLVAGSGGLWRCYSTLSPYILAGQHQQSLWEAFFTEVVFKGQFSVMLCVFFWFAFTFCAVCLPGQEALFCPHRWCTTRRDINSAECESQWK